jgi:transketolase
MGILGKTEELLGIEPLKDKFESFGFVVHVVDSHDFDEMRSIFSSDEFKDSDKCHVVIANTVKGKGVSYMEDVWQYHTIIPKDEDLLKTAMEDLS